ISVNSRLYFVPRISNVLRVEGVEPLGDVRAFPPRSQRLGATWDGSEGTTFAVTSADAHRVWVVLCDPDGRICSQHELVERVGTTWAGWIKSVGPGQRYAFRVDGEWNPGAGLRFNSRQLLVDPAARAVTPSATGTGRQRAERLGSSTSVPLSVVID